MHSSISRYAPSGAFSPLTFVYALGALLGACVLAGIYTFLIELIPFVYLNFLLVLGFGFGLGLMGSSAVSGGHCRNRGLGLGVGGVVGAGGLAASYGWSYLNSLRQASSSLGIPMMKLAQELGIDRWLHLKMESGWRIRRAEVSGTWVVVIWLLEAALVIGVPLLLSMFAAAEPYCEPCQAWTESQLGRIAGLSRENVQPLLERGDLAGLLATVEHPNPTSTVRIQLKRHHCPRCTETAYLTVSEVRTEVKEGKERERSTELLENAVLTQRLNAQFVERFARPEPSAVVAGIAN